MNNIGEECRNESYMSVDKETMHKLVLNILGNRELTAREIKIRGHFADMNSVRPRLNELKENGKIVVIGYKTCDYTGKKVSVFKVVS